MCPILFYNTIFSPVNVVHVDGTCFASYKDMQVLVFPESYEHASIRKQHRTTYNSCIYMFDEWHTVQLPLVDIVLVLL